MTFYLSFLSITEASIHFERDVQRFANHAPYSEWCAQGLSYNIGEVTKMLEELLIELQFSEQHERHLVFKHIPYVWIHELLLVVPFNELFPHSKVPILRDYHLQLTFNIKRSIQGLSFLLGIDVWELTNDVDG